MFFGFNALCAVTIAIVLVRCLVPAHKNALNAIEGLTRGANTASFIQTEACRLIKSAEVAMVEVPGLSQNIDDSLKYIAEAQRRALIKRGRGHQF